MFNQYILEARYLDNINRIKYKSIIGVYNSLEKIEDIKKTIIANEPKYKVSFSISPQFNPFIQNNA